MATKQKTRKRAPSLISKELLAKEISRIIGDREMTQTEAGYATGEAPSQISLISTGKLGGFSAERLLRTLTKLGRDVELRISKAKGKTGAVRVSTKG